MKKRINSYTFDASERQVTLTGITVDIDSLLLITNLADNVIIYNFADSTKTATAAGSVITLAYNTTSMSDSDPLQIFYDDAVSYPLTDSELRATAIPVSGSFYPATQPVSASALPLPAGAATEISLSNAVTAIGNLLTELQLKADLSETQPVSGPLTDTQLRASDVNVSLNGESVAVTGPLTDTQLRATAVPVSGTFYQATQPVSASALPLPTGASTEATLLNVITALGNLLTELQLKADLTETQPASVASLPLPAGASTETTLLAVVTGLATLLTELQAKTEPANEQTVWDAPAFNMLIRVLEQVSVPLWYDPSNNRLNVGGSVTASIAAAQTLATVTTVAGLTNIGGISANSVVQDMSGVSWGICIRGLLT